jgi:hypothetical protein
VMREAVPYIVIASEAKQSTAAHSG